jgi:hypothetical protein
MKNIFFYNNFDHFYFIQCVDECPEKTFSVVGTKTCDLCDSSCENCTISKTNCTSCPLNKFLYENLVNI